ncbi:MAG: hypothetical protein ACTHQM_24235 [Thermoanaerobaculia bacterium]
MAELLAEVEAAKETAGDESESTTETSSPEAVAGDVSPSDAAGGASWREQRYADADDAHGMFKGRTLGEVDDGIRRLEGTAAEAAERANRAEAKAAAAEVAAQMLQERLRKLTEELGASAAPAPTPEDPYRAAGLDLDSDIVMKPGQVFSVFEGTVLTKSQRAALEAVEQRLTKFEESLNQREAAKRQEELVRSLERRAEEVASTALTDLKIPKEHWKVVLDHAVPILTNKQREYAGRGGILEVDNYKHLITNDPIIRAAVTQMTAADTSTGEEARSPIVVKSRPRASASAPAAANLSREVRDLALMSARLAGIEDEAELQEHLELTARRIHDNRLERKRRKE